MGIEWFRDLVICVWGAIATVILVFLAILAYNLYKKAIKFLDSVEEAAQQGNQILVSVKSSAAMIQDAVSTVNQDMFRPVMQIVAIIQGVRYGADIIKKCFKDKKGESNDE
jgi:hypothetical protein